MSLVTRRNQVGDTIIEVAIAFVVFSLLAVGASMIMNRGVASAQESLETTLVRQQIDAQAETLRFLHQEYIKEYPTITGLAASTFEDIMARAPTGNTPASTFGDQVCLNEIPGNEPFLLRPDSPTNIIATTSFLHPINDSNTPAGYAIRDGNNAYGLWIEATRGADEGVVEAGTSFYDFHIRACWSGLTSDQARTLGTIVRLYVPS